MSHAIVAKVPCPLCEQLVEMELVITGPNTLAPAELPGEMAEHILLEHPDTKLVRSADQS